VRKQVLWASATLALVLGSATSCGSSSSAAPANSATSCVNQSAAHHAYIVVQHLSGATVQKCIGFNDLMADGQTLMNSSGLEYQTQTFSFGKAVCQVDNEPKQFDQCFPANQPTWELFVETNGAWTVAQTGYDQVILHDKDAMGWRYVQPTDPSPSPPPLAKEG
jgi:hypothetical protein